MTVVQMPRLSEGMEEGTLLRWLVVANALIAVGDEIAEVETDKATMNLQAETGGVLQPVVEEGDTVAVGDVIAHVLAAGESPPDDVIAPGTATEAPSDGTSPSEPATGETVGRVLADRASPLARRIAAEHGIDLSVLAGTGPHGRIVRRDVAGALSSPSAASPPASTEMVSSGDVMPAKGDVHVLELTHAQQLVARRMAEAKATIPEFSVSVDVDMGACIELRAGLKALGLAATPSYNDMIVKAAALALREHPKGNGSYRDGRIELYSRVNVGLAVAADESLVVPVVFDADAKSLGTIAADTRALARQVRDGSITPPSLAGGTFTVSNLGMFGVSHFNAIVNAPQAAILAVGALRDVVVHRDGAFVVRPVLTLTLVCDHRILYGADAARLVHRICELLELPASFVL